MSELYAIIDGENTKFASVTDEDNAKIGRGEEVRYYFGTVTDQETKKQFRVYQANCGADRCNCALTVEEV